MSKEYRITDVVKKEKYEERGWNQDRNEPVKSREKINSLPFSEEEYRYFCFLLSKLALADKNASLCELILNYKDVPIMETVSHLLMNCLKLNKKCGV